MFSHIFMYNLKTIFRNRPTIFWTLIYPIVLSTLFYFAFSNLVSAESFEPIGIAVVESSEFAAETGFYSALASVSDIDGAAEKEDIFRIQTVSQEEAEMLLENGNIAAYIFYDSGIKLAVADSGFGQTIAKVFIDDYLQASSTIHTILSQNPQAADQGLFTDFFERKEYLTEASTSASSPDTTVIYFYALLAMTCLMGSTVAVEEIIKLQANMSPLASRINLAPVAKFSVFLYNICATIVFQMVVILLVLAYLMFALQIDFGAKTGLIILTCLISCITGVFFGTTVSVGFKNTGIKYAITIGGTMLSCFLAGLMFVDIKYMIQEKAPIIGYISPANLITDAFYSLYYYDGLSRYFENILLLVAYTVVMCIVTCLVMRRKKYASI